MRSGSYLIALPFLALAVPASAQDVVFTSGTGEEVELSALNDGYLADNEGVADVADRASDPSLQENIAGTVEAMTAAVMDLQVGRVAEAIERARPGTVDRRIRRNSTVGDLAGRGADALPERMGDQSREMMGMMGGFAQAMTAMMPEIERMSREVEENFRTAKRNARRD